jgi:tetratricopeptide (TPR) repeat protein
MSDERIPTTSSPLNATSAGRTLNIQAQTLGPLGILTTLQPDVERARGEHALRHAEAVSAILSGVIATIQSCIQSQSLDPQTRASFDLLLASSNCLLGRSATAKGNANEAAPFYAVSLQLFESNAGEIPLQHNFSQLWTDFGIALFRTGGLERAIAILLTVATRGVPIAETYHYLALAYMARAQGGGREENLHKAVDAANDGLKLASGDPGLYCTLAEALAALGDNENAVSMFVKGALGAARKNDSTATNDLVTRALELDPRHQDAVVLAVEVKRAQQDFNGALQLVDSVLAVPPQPPWAIALKGRLERDLGRPEEAVKLFEQVPIARDTAWVASELASALLASGEAKAAAAAVDKALEFQPQDSGALLIKGRLLIEQSNFKDAVPVLQNALQADPTSPFVRYELGRAFYFSKDYTSAVGMFDSALEVSPEWAQAASAKAMGLYEMGEFGAAFSQARRALKLSPGDPSMLDILRDAARNQGREDDALREMEIELARDPHSARAWYLKGSILLDRNDLDGAVDALQQAATLNPRNGDVHMTFCNALRLSGRYDDAGRECDAALTCEPLSGFALGWAGIYFGEVGEFGKACEALSRATGVSPDAGWIWGSLGWALQYRDNASAKESLDAYNRALKEDGDDRNIWNVKGQADAYFLCGETEKADESHLALLKQFTDISDPSVLYVHGWAHYRLRDYDQAAELLKRAADLSPEYIYARFDSALALLACGKTELARSAYTSALSDTGWVHQRRQRGLLYVSIFDIAEAVRNNRVGPEAASLFAYLLKRLARVWPEAVEMPWIKNPWPSTPATAS